MSKAPPAILIATLALVLFLQACNNAEVPSDTTPSSTATPTLSFINATEGQTLSGYAQPPGVTVQNATPTNVWLEFRKSDGTGGWQLSQTTAPLCVIQTCQTWNTPGQANGSYYIRAIVTLSGGQQLTGKLNFNVANGVTTPPPSPPPPSPPPSPPPASGYATAPTAPQAYTVPAGAVRVTTTAEFIREFTKTSPEDIVLADGTYDNGSSVMAAAPHRIWASRLGGSRLTFGLAFESNFSSGGAEVHGLAFDITNASKTSQSAAIRIAGDRNRAVKIEDVTVNGNRSINAGIQAFNSDGFILRRCVVSNVFDYGVFVHPYGNVSYTYVPGTTPIVEDCDISGVYRNVRASNNGQSEACMWVGVSIVVNRIRMRNCGWMGLETTGNTNNARFSDLIIEDTKFGIYVEHWTRNTIFERFQIGALSGSNYGPAGFPTKYGVITEWADPAYAGKNPVAGQSLGASQTNTFRNGFINSYQTGVFTDDGEYSTVTGIKFVNQRFSAISEFRNAGTYNMTQSGNDFSSLVAGVYGYTKLHPNNYSGSVP